MNKKSFGKHLFPIGSLVLYAVLFLVLEPIAGPPIASLSILPVLVWGRNYGLWGGLVAVSLYFPINFLLFSLTTDRAVQLILNSAPSVFLTLVPAALLIGSARDLNKRLQAQNEELSAAKTTLSQQSVKLEQEVASRTRQLEEKMQQLEELNKVMVGRELTMKEMKEEIERLKGGDKK